MEIDTTSNATVAPENPPSHSIDTPSDHTGLVVIVGWYLWVVTFIFSMLRFIGRKYFSKRNASFDDLLLALALLTFALYQSLMHVASLHGGLGLMDMSTAQIDPGYHFEYVEKFLYAGNIFSVISIALSRWSTVPLLISVFSMTRIHFMVTQLHYPLAIWAIVAFVLLLFGCSPPRVWSESNNKCMNRTAAYTFIAIFGALIDIALVALPTYAITKTPLYSNTRRLISIIFMFRAGMVICLVAQLAYLWQAANQPQLFPNPFMNVWVVIATQLVCCWSILSACVPFMKPLVDEMGLGIFTESKVDSTSEGIELSQSRRPLVQKHYRYLQYNNYLSNRPSQSDMDSAIHRISDADRGAVPMPIDVSETYLRRRSRVIGQDITVKLSATPDLHRECGRTAAQKRRQQEQEQARAETGGIRPQMLALPLAGPRLGRMTTSCRCDGRFDFSEDETPSRWIFEDGIDITDLPMIDKAENHGMCSVPGCPAGFEFPRLDRYPEVERLEIYVTKGFEVREEVIGVTA